MGVFYRECKHSQDRQPAPSHDIAVKLENTPIDGPFIGRRFARFKNLMWMHAGDRNPDPNLAECARVLGRAVSAAAPPPILRCSSPAPVFITRSGLTIGSILLPFEL